MLSLKRRVARCGTYGRTFNRARSISQAKTKWDPRVCYERAEQAVAKQRAGNRIVFQRA